MKGMLIDLKYVLVINDCLDLPSLTRINGHDCMGSHRFIGHVFLESMI